MTCFNKSCVRDTVEKEGSDRGDKQRQVASASRCAIMIWPLFRNKINSLKSTSLAFYRCSARAVPCMVRRQAGRPRAAGSRSLEGLRACPYPLGVILLHVYMQQINYRSMGPTTHGIWTRIHALRCDCACTHALETYTRDAT